MSLLLDGTDGITGLTTVGEVTSITGTGAVSAINFDILNQAILYYNTAATGNFTLNFRGNSGVTLDSIMGIEETRTVSFLATQGGTAYYATAYQIDGTAITPKWINGVAVTSGDINSIDVYSVTIIKTAAATFTMLVSVTPFA